MNLFKKRLWHRCFPVNFDKFLRTPFFIEHLCWLLLKNLWNIIWWSQFLQLNFIKDFKSSFNSLLWNTIWNNWIIYYVSQARKLSIMPVNNCILEYVKKDKSHFADFFYLASEAWIVCRILSKVKNELKIYIIYICDFRTDIFITHVCVWILKNLISLTLRDTLERIPKVISDQNLFSRFQSWCWFWCWSWCLNFV